MISKFYLLKGGIAWHCWYLTWLHWTRIHERCWFLPNVKSLANYFLRSLVYSNSQTGFFYNKKVFFNFMRLETEMVQLDRNPDRLHGNYCEGNSPGHRDFRSWRRQGKKLSEKVVLFHVSCILSPQSKGQACIETLFNITNTSSYEAPTVSQLMYNYKGICGANVVNIIIILSQIIR